MSRKLSNLLACLSVVMACTPGCQVTDPPEASASVESDERVVEPPPTDTTLATVRLSTTHIVEFSESSDGDVEVVEKLVPDSDGGQPSLAEVDAEHATLAEIHRHLLPTTRVPDALVAADVRAAARTAAPTPPASVDFDAFAASDTASDTAPAPAILWDWGADAAWFAQNFYTGGTAGFFAANVTWANVTKYRRTIWFKASAFNQSFEASAWFRVKRSYKCGLGECTSTKLSTAVAPRSVITYLGTGDRFRQAWMDGYGPTARIGLAVRWVLSGSSQPQPPPTSCGGHNQLICFFGQHCQAGLHEYNGGCYGCGTVGQACCKDWGPVPTPGGAFGFCAQGICDYPGGYCRN
jgi:hypothetical protein